MHTSNRRKGDEESVTKMWPPRHTLFPCRIPACLGFGVRGQGSGVRGWGLGARGWGLGVGGWKKGGEESVTKMRAPKHTLKCGP